MLFLRTYGNRAARRYCLAARLLATGLRFVAELALGPGYVLGDVAMVATILLMIVLNMAYPPAALTACAFASVLATSAVG